MSELRVSQERLSRFGVRTFMPMMPSSTGSDWWWCWSSSWSSYVSVSLEWCPLSEDSSLLLAAALVRTDGGGARLCLVAPELFVSSSEDDMITTQSLLSLLVLEIRLAVASRPFGFIVADGRLFGVVGGWSELSLVKKLVIFGVFWALGSFMARQPLPGVARCGLASTFIIAHW